MDGSVLAVATAYTAGLHNLLLSLEPIARAWLHARIAERFDAMLAAGLIYEVKSLRARGIMMDDIVAGVYTNIILQIAFRFISGV